MADTRLEPLALSEDERRTLENWVKRRSTAQGLALRARIVLACAQGGSNLAVAARLGVDRKTVRKWRARFLAGRLDGLSDEPRPGVPRTITDAQVEEVVVRTLEQVPEGATHWSKRELAARAGISQSSVLRVWRAFGLQAGDCGGELCAPGPGSGDAQPQAAAAADDAADGGEQPQPQPFGFPGAGGAVQGEHRHPGQQLNGHCNLGFLDFRRRRGSVRLHN